VIGEVALVWAWQGNVLRVTGARTRAHPFHGPPSRWAFLCLHVSHIHYEVNQGAGLPATSLNGDVMHIIYFNSKVMDSIIIEVRRISWASILMAFVIGYQRNNGFALVVGSGLWCVSQILAFILQTH
jgi:hypothetical protein